MTLKPPKPPLALVYALGEKPLVPIYLRVRRVWSSA
jgi:hypothetical protein